MSIHAAGNDPSGACAQRRLDIIRATWRVIDRIGIANATTREIAREAGFSSGVLAHYFKDKSDIMANAMLAAHTEVVKRMERSKLEGLAGLREFMLQCLPLDARRVLLARIEISFWGMAVGDDELIALFTDEINRGYQSRVLAFLGQARARGELADSVDERKLARELHVLMDGLSAQAAINATAPKRAEQTEMLDAILDRARS
ncbi:MAG: TetR/AcrR family transcriptional regulator [Cumulibacter sp.]